MLVRDAPRPPCRRWSRGLPRLAAAIVLVIVLTLAACTADPPVRTEKEPETIARTEFTDRIENFFEHERLTPGKPSRFLIHLTDLSDGAPVADAEVSLTVRPRGRGEPVAAAKARVGKVTGIYVAEVTVPQRGSYDIEFHVKNPKLDERLPLTDFQTTE